MVCAFLLFVVKRRCWLRTGRGEELLTPGAGYPTSFYLFKQRWRCWGRCGRGSAWQLREGDLPHSFYFLLDYFRGIEVLVLDGEALAVIKLGEVRRHGHELIDSLFVLFSGIEIFLRYSLVFFRHDFLDFVSDGWFKRIQTWSSGWGRGRRA